MDDNSLKTEDIRFKLIAFDSVRLTLHVNIKNMYLLLKNNISFPKKLRFSCFTPVEIYILAMIDNNSLKSKDIRLKLVGLGSIRFECHIVL